MQVHKDYMASGGEQVNKKMNVYKLIQVYVPVSDEPNCYHFPHIHNQ